MKKLTALCMVCILLFTAGLALAEGKTLVVATNPEFPPFEYVEGNNIVGLDIDIAAEVAKDLGMEIAVEAMEFPAIIPSLNAGKADLGIAGMTVTEERKMNVDFSDTYYNAIQACVVKEGTAITDFKTKKKAVIGVQEGTTGDFIVSEYPDAEILRFPKGLDAFMELANGKIDAVVIDAPVAANILKALNNQALETIEMPFEDEFYAIALPKGSTELLEAVNATIKRIQEDGTLEALIEKHFPSAE